MHQLIELKNEQLTCAIRADLGGSILSLLSHGRSVLRAVDLQRITSARQSGSFALVPPTVSVMQRCSGWEPITR